MRESTAKAQNTGNPASVLVVGAGPAGVVTGYFLKQAGIDYEIVDRADVVASTWASLYPSLRLNTSRYFSHMPHKKFPRAWGTFPTGQQYQSYVADFAHAHALNISFGVEITAIRPENGGWRVESSRGTAWYRAIVLASGRFSSPYLAPIRGMERFTGLKLHASQFRHPHQLADMRVMVIGSGPSGIDIAVDVGRHNAPQNPVLLSVRTGIMLYRRYPFGLSKHAWVLAARGLPNGIRENLLNYMEKMAYRPAAMRGIPAPDAGAATGAVAYRGPELINAVRRGHVVCVAGVTEISENSVTLADGTNHAVDALVIATGYRPALGFLDGVHITPDEQGWPKRYNSQPYALDYTQLTYRGTYDVGAGIDAHFRPTLREIDGCAGLFQVGLYYKGNGAMYNFNIEAEITAAQLKQYLKT